MAPFLIAISVFIGVTALVIAVASMLRGDAKTAMEDRLALLTGNKLDRGSKDALLKDSVLAQPLEATPHFFESLVARFNLRLLFDQADTTLTVQNFCLFSSGFALTAAAVGGFAGLNPGFAFPVALACGFLPLLWILIRRKRRFAAFARQLPDALELVARALRAGHSLASGLHLVSDEMADPIGKEFGRAFEEQNLGIPLEEALENMTERIPNLDLRFFATAVILQRQTGGDLAEILDKIGYIVRERFKIHGQVQALTGEGRLSGVVLLGLPPVLFLAVYRLNPEYVMKLFTDPMGKKMLVGAVVMQLLGALVIRKIINIKV